MPKALATFDHACASGQEHSCMHLAALYFEGKVVAADAAKAMSYDQQACDRSAASPACSVLGWVLITGQNGAPKDPKRGLAILRSAAAAGSATAKGLVANALADGLAGTKDLREALKLYEQACADADGSSCYAAGEYYRRGIATVADAAKGIAYTRKACDLKFVEACDGLKAIATDEEAASALDARALWKAYDDNEVSADNQYKGKRLAIRGIVQSVDKDVTGSAVVQLASPNEFAPVGVYVRDDQLQAVAALHKQDAIAVRCICAGKTLMSPVLRDCEILRSPR